jgi:serine phosphatase RsbU (regulator of sigma subunit)
MDWEQSKLQYAGANNSLYLVRNNILNEIKPDKMPIGFHFKQMDFTNNELDISPGDILYLFSDGFADQFGGPKGKKFKYRQFKDMLTSINHMPMNGQKTIIEERLARRFRAIR